MQEGLELAIAVSHILDKILNSEHLILHLLHVTGFFFKAKDSFNSYNAIGNSHESFYEPGLK